MKVKENICYNCEKVVGINRSLLKLKDNYWYCFSCIKTDLENLFSQLKINGYWHSLLKPFIYSKYSKFRNKK